MNSNRINYDLERKLRRYAIYDLMKYIVIGQGLVYILMYVWPSLGYQVYSMISLSRSAILRGQIWRLVTFVFAPPASSPLFVLFALYFYYMIGSGLERRWGKVKFNLYYGIGMLCAIAFVIVAFVRIPVVAFLKYEPKDVVITIGGFLFGPLSAFLISAVVSLVEMVTISDTGIIGCIMNLLSTCSFAFTAALCYKRRHTMSGAITGLLTGTVTMVATMLLWNYLITPLYMTGTSRSDIAGMLMPVFLPFNLLKAGLNSSFILLLYKPLGKYFRGEDLV